MDTTDELSSVGSRRQRYERLEREAAEKLYALVADALRSGARPGEVARRAQLSPAQVRIVARRAGLDPARRGPTPKEEAA